MQGISIDEKIGINHSKLLPSKAYGRLLILTCLTSSQHAEIVNCHKFDALTLLAQKFCVKLGEVDSHYGIKKNSHANTTAR
jgi:hypothetical protein